MDSPFYYYIFEHNNNLDFNYFRKPEIKVTRINDFSKIKKVTIKKKKD